ncbi:MAG: hypothetical protein ACPGSH_02430, partial [Ilumatobacteraceae bacterium]
AQHERRPVEALRSRRIAVVIRERRERIEAEAEWVQLVVAEGVAAGEFRQVSPAIVAGVLAGSGLYFNQVEITHPDPTDEMLDLVIRSILA